MDNSENKNMNSSENTIQSIAHAIVDETSEVMKTAQSEEDLGIAFEKILGIHLQQLGLKTYPKYEKTIFEAGKRSDALHGQIIIEYEKPRSLQSKGRVDHAFEQLAGYISGEAEANKDVLDISKPKYIGVGFDGGQIFFVRYKGQIDSDKNKIDRSEFVLAGPFNFDHESARTLLTYFRALTKFLLTPENLAERFGPSGKIAPVMVTAFTDAIQNWSDRKIKVFFDEWKRLFGIVYGEHFNNNSQKDLETLNKLYNIKKDVGFQELLFCIHTYFALLMKLIAADLLALKDSTLTSLYSQKLVHLSESDLKRQLYDIEQGGIFAKRGISNFLEGDFFSWYLNAFSSPRLQEGLREMIRALSNFEPATSLITPETTVDLLKKLYQYLVPKEVRHRLGEYYSPDWLAELTLNELGYEGKTTKRLLDPACGSGTFLALAIQKAKESDKKQNNKRIETAKQIVNNIWGFDLNPLAIIASRTNYLFAMGELIEELDEVEIPVYLADSVLCPERTSGQMEIAPAYGKHIKMHTSVGSFHVPYIWIKDNGILLKRAAPLIEWLVKDQFESEIALKHLKEAGCAYPPHEKTVEHFYNEILELEKGDKNGIWARFLKNVFAPIMAGKFDYIAGNPPWIRWGYLAREYRNATLNLWKNYGLFSLKGFEARLGGGEKDFSMLFVYSVTDNFLKNGGKLGFLITQEVFKSKGAGEGFRKFYYGDNDKRTYLKVLKAHDFVSLQPFEGAANKSAAIFLKKGEKTKYPVPYYVWSKKKGAGRIQPNMPAKETSIKLKKRKLLARPIGKLSGSWQTLTLKQKNLKKISGENYYKARLGARVEPYGVFWINIQQTFKDDTAIVNNLYNRGKREVFSVTERIETDLIYPIVSGRDVGRWGAIPKHYVVLPQDTEKREPYPEKYMKENYPRTFNYLTNFKEILLSRGSKTVRNLAERTAFYAMFGIGEYTVARYKVVWKRMAQDIYASVISQYKTPFGYKTVVPTDTTSLFATQNLEEAHYLCAIINSETVREFVKSYSSGGRGFGVPSIMKHIGIPKFEEDNGIHTQLSEISSKLHKFKQERNDKDIPDLENETNTLVKKIFEL